MSVGSEGGAVDEGVADDVGGLLLGQAEQLGDDGRGGNLDEDDVV